MRKKKQAVAVRIETERYGLPYPFSPAFNIDDAQEFLEALLGPQAEDEPEDDAEDAPAGEDAAPEKREDAEPERSSFFSEGALSETADRVEIVYEESVITGMEGSVTSIGFSKSDPSVVTMFRKGIVNTAFVFEPLVRHICVYETPMGGFELCVHALAVRNALLSEGVLELDYLTELHGARAERCKMKIRIDPLRGL